MIEYKKDYLIVNGNPFLFVPADVIDEGMCGYYFGKFKTSVDKNDLSPRLEFIFDDYSPYFNISNSSKRGISLELYEEVSRKSGDTYAYKIISVNFNMDCPEYKKIIDYYKNYKCSMPLDKFDLYSKKILGISEDFK